MSRLRVIALASAAAAAFTACGRTPEIDAVTPTGSLKYQPFDAAYTGATHLIVQQDFNGQTVTTESGMHFFARVELLRAGETMSATIVLDSVVWVQGQLSGVVQAQLDSARGATFLAAVAPTGEMTEWTGDDEAGGVAHQIAQQFFSQLLPVTPADGLSEGASWSDTLRTTADLGGVNDAMLEAVNHHRVAGWTADFSSETALEIRTESRYTISGTGSQIGQPFTIAGTGTRHARQFVAADGRYLGAVSADTLLAEAELSDAGITVPVRQIRTDTLTQVAR